MSGEECPAGVRAIDVYMQLRRGILNGEFEPGQALRPQHLATGFDVSLAVVREALVRLVGDGLAVRPNGRGFAVPAFDADQWQLIAEARGALESNLLRMAIKRGDLQWEARVRSAHHVLQGTPMYRAGGVHFTDEWSEVHRIFHRTLLDGCRNSVLMEMFDRLWLASELSRRWSVGATPGREIEKEHTNLEGAALSRDADQAVRILLSHLNVTAAALRWRPTNL